MKQIKPRVLKKETKAIIATGRRVVLRSPGRGSVLNGDGKNPLESRVACGTKEDTDMDIAFIQSITGILFEARQEVEICRKLE
jgi:hypothetical protein